MSEENDRSNQPKVDQETAELEFIRCMEAMDMDPAPKHRDQEDLASFEDSKFEFINAIKGGSLTVDGMGDLHYTPKSSRMKDPIHFGEPDGEVLLAMDRVKGSHSFAKNIAVLSKWSGRPEIEFKAMKQRDHRVLNSILGLFLASRSKPY